MNILINKDEKLKIISALNDRVETFALHAVKYLDLGVSTIRVLCYTPDILPVMQRQLGYVLRDASNHFDSTIVVWKDSDVSVLLNSICSDLAFKKAMRVRAEMLWAQKGNYPLHMSFFTEYPDATALGHIDSNEERTEFLDTESGIAYLSCKSYEPEDLVKNGHIFVKEIYRLIKNDRVSLTHGAVFGYAGSGFLLCGRGKRGKSTLTVDSMLQGCDYVSDDYQILRKSDDGLFAYPIYSIVTLSYRMYNEMYDRFLGKFVSNNFAQDKYLFNIAPYYGQFRTEYPIRFCLFPEIVTDEHPSIIRCTAEEKGRAVIHMVHSTLMQMGDLGDPDTVRKLLLMIWDLPFVRFNLCNNIAENTEYLKRYLETMPDLLPDDSEIPLQLLDITDGQATILDTLTCRFTQMNRFASNVYMQYLSGRDTSLIKDGLAQFINYNPDIADEYVQVLELIRLRGLNTFKASQYPSPDLMTNCAQECNYRLSVTETVGAEEIELIK